MEDVRLVGIELGKHVFHLHGQKTAGKAVFRKKVSRKQLVKFFATLHACTVVMEASSRVAVSTTRSFECHPVLKHECINLGGAGAAREISCFANCHRLDATIHNFLKERKQSAA